MVTHKQIWRLAFAVGLAGYQANRLDSQEERDEANRWLDEAGEAIRELRRMLREEKQNG